MNSEDLTLKALNSNFAGAIQNIISESCIMEYGIVKKVLAKGVVTVAVSVANSEKDIRVITCILANMASQALTVNIEPVEGDKVLVVFPRRYSEEMFSVDNKDIIIDENAIGFSMLSGIALLFNQCKTKSYKNLITADKDGNFELKIGDKVDIQLNADGTMNVTNGTAKIEVASDNSITINGHLKVTS